jgi:RhtB (resistance to homoserine/threonine) family protein
MGSVSILLSIAAIWSIAAITPGPNLFIIMRNTASGSRRQGLATVLGIAVGTLIWGLAGFFGISALFAAAPWLYVGLKIVGGAYLIYLGVKLIRASFQKQPTSLPNQKVALVSFWQSWRLGFLTNISNPKTAMFVTSLFATTMPANPDVSVGLLAVALMVAISVTWYAGMALAFSSNMVGRVYGRINKFIDRVAGAIFVAFGTKLALEN